MLEQYFQGRSSLTKVEQKGLADSVGDYVAEARGLAVLMAIIQSADEVNGSLAKMGGYFRILAMTEGLPMPWTVEK